MSATETQITPKQKAEVAALALLLCGMCPADDGKRLLEELSPGDFGEPEHQWIFEAMVWLGVDQEPLDIITVASRLEEMRKLAAAGGRAYLFDLAMCSWREEPVSQILSVLKSSAA